MPIRSRFSPSFTHAKHAANNHATSIAPLNSIHKAMYKDMPKAMHEPLRQKARFVARYLWLIAIFIGFASLISSQSFAQQILIPPPNPATPQIASPQAAPASANILSAEPRSDIRKELEAAKLQLTQIEATLTRSNLSDEVLAGLRERLQPLELRAAEIISLETPRLASIKARIEQLGPKPDAAKGESESADVGKDREEQAKSLAEADETIRLTKLLALRGDQIQNQITERRRQLFANAVVERSYSLFSPWLWGEVVKFLPREGQAFMTLLDNWMSSIRQNSNVYKLSLLGLIFLIAGFAARPATTLARQIGAHHLSETAKPNKAQIALHALKSALVEAFVPVLLSFILYTTLSIFDFLPERIASILKPILLGICFVFFARGLARGVLSPRDANWRFLDISDHSARILFRLVTQITIAMLVGRALDAIYQAIVSSLPVSIVGKGSMACLIALALIHALRQFGKESEQNAFDADCLGPRVPELAPPPAMPYQLLGWLLAGAILIALAFGYISLASFLSHQIVWVVLVIITALLIMAILDNALGDRLSATGDWGQQLRATTGLSSGSVEQASVLSSGIARLILILAAVMLILAPWGVDGGDMIGSLRAALFGFSIGNVTISLSTIVLAIALFIIGMLTTRTIKRWLETHYLPHTNLDIGLRNSIGTIFGYVGITLAAFLSLSHLGLSLDKLTIVAGALSVGIGFGLQSIVNNFVSGLILLWERPLRVGDSIVVGGEDGIVRRINVRSTEVETYDRASLIVPNSEFISGRVKNWTHHNALRRVILPVSVSYGTDPEQLRNVLIDIARQNPNIIVDPAPMVFFRNLGDHGMEFDMRYLVQNEHFLTSQSELLFAIITRFEEEGINLTSRNQTISLKGLDALGHALPKKAEDTEAASAPTSSLPQSEAPSKADIDAPLEPASLSKESKRIVEATLSSKKSKKQKH